MGGFVRLLRMASILAALAVTVPAFADDSRTEVRVGVLAYRGAEEADRTWEPTLAYLARALPQYRFQMVTGSAAFLTAAVAAHRLDFLITNPGHYLELKVGLFRDARWRPNRRSKVRRPSEAIGAAVVALSSRLELQGLSDLRNLKVAAVAPDAFGARGRSGAKRSSAASTRRRTSPSSISAFRSTALCMRCGRARRTPASFARAFWKS